MERQGIWDAGREKETRSEVRKEVLKAFAEAEKEKRPAIREMFTDVYEELSEEARGHMSELRGVLERYPNEYDVEEYEGGVDSLEP